MHDALRAVTDALELKETKDRIEAHFVAVRRFYMAYASVVAKQLSTLTKLQILLAGASAIAFACAHGEKATLEQFIAFLTDHSEDSLLELSSAMEEYAYTIASRDRALVILDGFDTSDQAPN
jgi:hypothetical protein